MLESDKNVAIMALGYVLRIPAMPVNRLRYPLMDTAPPLAKGARVSVLNRVPLLV